MIAMLSTQNFVLVKILVDGFAMLISKKDCSDPSVSAVPFKDTANLPTTNVLSSNPLAEGGTRRTGVP